MWDLECIDYKAFDSNGLELALDDCDAKVYLAFGRFTSGSIKVPAIDSTIVTRNYNKTLQSEAVRRLLFKLVEQAKLCDEATSISLNETSFPYKLVPLDYCVSFSHSQHSIACAISQSGAIGIDIELRPISFKTAKRFYHPNESAWLDGLKHECHLLQATTILWMLKEAYIKYHGGLGLIKGLTYDFSSMASALLFNPTTHQARAITAKPIVLNTSIRAINSKLQNPTIKNFILYLPSHSIIAIV